MNCSLCGMPRGERVFCTACSALTSRPDSRAYAASPLRRLSAAVLDTLLVLASLGIGWLIWLAFVAPRSQTPGKQLLGIYILRSDGTLSSACRVWVREVLVKTIAFGLAGLVTFYVMTLLDALWVLWDKDRQTLHDKLVDTVVVRPQGPADIETLRKPLDQARETGRGLAYRSNASLEERLRELQELMAQGLITLQEYEDRRRRILE